MKAFNCYNHGDRKIDLSVTDPDVPSHMYRTGKPIQIHLKEDGAKDGRASFCIVIELSNGNRILGEISVAMLNEGLKDIGYVVDHCPVN